MLVSIKLVKIQSIIDRLEAQGFHVHLKHINSGDSQDIQYTFFGVERETDNVSAHGVARCARGDNYHKIKGTQIAFSYAMRKLSEKLGPGELRKILE